MLITLQHQATPQIQIGKFDTPHRFADVGVAVQALQERVSMRIHPADRQSRIQAKYQEVETTSNVGFSSLAANISQIHTYLVQIVKRRPVKLAKFYSKII